MSDSQRRLDAPAPGTQRATQVAAVVAFALAAVGALLPGSVGRAAAIAGVVCIVAVPLLRVLSLAMHWLRVGDRRYAGMAFCLLAIVAAGSVIAAF